MPESKNLDEWFKQEIETINDADRKAFTQLMDEMISSGTSDDMITEFFARARETDDLTATAAKLGLVAIDEELVTKMRSLVGDSKVDLDAPLSQDD